MNTLIFALYASSSFTDNLIKQISCELGNIEIHSFPDGESLIKIKSDVKNKKVIFIASLDRPNEKLLPMVFAAQTARALGASEIGLIAPYLAYMRQDKTFKTGEGITSQYYAKLLSEYFNWLITISPHLHRYHSLNELYSMPAYALQATVPISVWIKQNVSAPLIIGPDQESSQWVSEIARNVDAPFIVLEKNRSADRKVSITMPSLEKYKEYTPVILDDIVSTAMTMIETVTLVKKQNSNPSICVAVHPVFANDAYDELKQAGVAKIVSCNTIAHASNLIDVSEVVAHCYNENMNK